MPCNYKNKELHPCQIKSFTVYKNSILNQIHKNAKNAETFICKAV